jgi:hypothetical protein
MSRQSMSASLGKADAARPKIGGTILEISIETQWDDWRRWNTKPYLFRRRLCLITKAAGDGPRNTAENFLYVRLPLLSSRP